MIPQSVVGLLEDDSNNVVQLISEACNVSLFIPTAQTQLWHFSCTERLMITSSTDVLLRTYRLPSSWSTVTSHQAWGSPTAPTVVMTG